MRIRVGDKGKIGDRRWSHDGVYAAVCWRDTWWRPLDGNRSAVGIRRDSRVDRNAGRFRLGLEPVFAEVAIAEAARFALIPDFGDGLRKMWSQHRLHQAHSPALPT